MKQNHSLIKKAAVLVAVSMLGTSAFAVVKATNGYGDSLVLQKPGECLPTDSAKMPANTSRGVKHISISKNFSGFKLVDMWGLQTTRSRGSGEWDLDGAWKNRATWVCAL